MIARLWRGLAGSPASADAYQKHVTTNVLPALRGIDGHCGARVLRHDQEFIVVTFWESMDAIRKFAGADAERAVVEPEAQAVLTEYDRRARHYEVVQ
jgi:heme-degrading monooxygenase HmoA